MAKVSAVRDLGRPVSEVRPDSKGRVARALLVPSKLHLVLVVLLLAATLALAIWRFSSVQRLEGEVAATRVEAREAMTVQAGELLQLTAIPLAWAIRSGVVANDMRDVDVYMDKLVQERFVKRIVFVAEDGVIQASTNTKLKGQPAATALPGVDLAVTKPKVESVGEETRIIVPVMSYERQVGALVLEYSTSRSIDSKLAP